MNCQVHSDTWNSGAPGLAVGIAPVALSLAGGLVFEQPRDVISFRRLARLGFGTGCGFCGRLPLVGLGYPALSLVALYPLAL